jgi:SAM-dependent methyltransferase
MWREMGRPFSEHEAAVLRGRLADALNEGFEKSPHALAIVTYQINPVPESNLGYSVRVQLRDVAQYYDDWADKAGETALFGAHADAKVLALARSILATPREQPWVLDVGAGDGRNALPLVELGCAVDALEPSSKLQARLAAAAQARGLRVRVLPHDLLAEDLALGERCYALIVASEVVTHLRDATQWKAALARLAPALEPGGVLLFNAFVARGGYNPSSLLLQAAQTSLASVLTRAQIDAAVAAEGLALISDESAYDFEKAHLPQAAWPPTPWFESWATGRNIVDLEASRVPVELRWITVQRPAAS